MWDWRLSGGGSLGLRYLHATRDQSVISQETQVSIPGTNFSRFFERLQIREEQDWGTFRYRQPVGFKWNVEAAIEGVFERVTATERTINPITNIVTTLAPVTDYIKTWSGLVDASWTASDRWDLEGGIRYDNDELFGSAVSPRLTVAFRPASGWTLRALAGRTFRPPKPIFAEVCCGQAYQRNINVRKETAWTYGFEGVYQPSPVWRVSLYLARTDFDDFIVRLVGWSQLYRQTYALANVPSARSETAEIGAKWSPTDWFTLDGSIGWLSFFNRGESDVKILIFPPSSTALSAVFKPIDRIPYRPVRTGSLTTRFTLPHRVVLSLQGNYTGQQLIQQFAPPPITSAANGLLDEMRQVPSFWMVNFSVQAPVHRMLDIVAGVDNLTDEIQYDLHDPTRDYNWGPLAGRSYRFDLRFHLDR
jgi:outer membrane receptor protein involved in Fe transport